MNPVSISFPCSLPFDSQLSGVISAPTGLYRTEDPGKFETQKQQQKRAPPPPAADRGMSQNFGKPACRVLDGICREVRDTSGYIKTVSGTPCRFQPSATLKFLETLDACVGSEGQQL